MADQEILKQYNTIGKDYVDYQRTFFANKEDWTRSFIRKTLSELKDGKVLDIGCGAGDDVKWCEEQNIAVAGIDPSETMCDLARENVVNPGDIKVGEFDHIPYKDQTFSLIISRFALHYLKGFEKAYEEMARVLQPNGKIVLVVSHPTYDISQISQTNDLLVSTKLYNGKVTVRFPGHTFSDYFSSTFFNLFDLTVLKESASLDAENPQKIPETLLYVATKRS